MATLYLVYCDGACSGNPGPGGWGTIIQTPEQSIIELGGGAPQSTNNRMEMMAALEAMKWIFRDPLCNDGTYPSREPKKVKIYTDSNYLIKGMTEWMTGWRKRGWKNAEGKPVANQDLWEELSSVAAHLKVTWVHVRGHAGVAGNERADKIAVSFAQGNGMPLYQGASTNYFVKMEM